MSDKVFKIDGEDIILYLSHFERSDPDLSSVTKAKITKIQPDKQLTRKSVPRIKRNVVLDKLRFDIMYIVYNIVNYKKVTAYPRATFSIFDPVSGKLWSVSPLVVEILALCDGRKSIQQIAHELSNKHNTARPKIEEDCIAFLEPLSREGYVLF